MGTEIASSGGKGVPCPRLRRKSAKAAAALVSAVAKEEVTVPEGRPAPVKRSYARSQSAPTKSTRAASAGVSSSGIHPNKKKTALSQHAVQYLKNWMLSPAHIEHPYPTEEEKVQIMKTTGIEIKQLTNWFVNNRKRYWKPKVEEYKRRSSESNLTVKQIAAKEWSGLDDNNAIVSDEGTDTEKSQPKKKKQRTSTSSSKNGGGDATILPATSPKAKKKNRVAKVKQGKASPSMPVLTPGIATAQSHDTIKAANAMRYVGDTSSSSDEDLEEDAATIFSSSTVESKVNEASSNDATIEETNKLASLPMEWTNGVCGCVADPLQFKVFHNGEPCALCAACRDWNAGEFCPWDLTGIIGNIQSELPGAESTVMTDIPSPVERTVSEGELDLDAKMIASPSSSTFETPQDTSNETWEIADTW
mmetsp:Transcript_1855/g.2930  ORF Transcript_1855/g.2930 Transcript_1855/m.2930 type:complete len:419 (-) Transcript_1855:286-1542(-)